MTMIKRAQFVERLRGAFSTPLTLEGNYVVTSASSQHANQQQTNEVFTEKWNKYAGSENQDRLYEFQRQWYLKLYGFADENALRAFLLDCDVVFDAGCGLGYKAVWFAELAPHALVIGMDFSEAAEHAARRYESYDNLYFVRGDIAHTCLHDGSIDYVSCDQVIMHTEDPEVTFAELSRVARRPAGQVACYFYAKKALPRELLDDHFRQHCRNVSREQLWAMSAQLAELGRRLSALNVSFEAPDIPELGIKGGTYDIQRFVYWNFLKCFWNDELGEETSVLTNFDWYSPSNARRFSEQEVLRIVGDNALTPVTFHAEEACYSGRFVRA